MARRGKKSVQWPAIAALGGVLLLGAGGAWTFLKKTSSPASSLQHLDPREYLEGASALSNNTYQVKGRVEDRLDNWRSSQGRVFSIRLDNGQEADSIHVIFPPELNGETINRGQDITLKVRIDDMGNPVVQEVIRI